MAAIPLPSPFKIFPPPPPLSSAVLRCPPPLSSAALRRPILHHSQPKLVPPRPSSLPVTVKIVSITECSDGCIVFRFADGEALKREEREAGEKMEGEAERCDLVVESEVVVEDSDVVCEEKLDEVEVFDELTERGSELEVESEVGSSEETDRETETESVSLHEEHEVEVR